MPTSFSSLTLWSAWACPSATLQASAPRFGRPRIDPSASTGSEKADYRTVERFELRSCRYRKHIGESSRPAGSTCYSPDVCWRLRPRGQVKPSAWWPRQRLSAHRRAVRLAPQNLRTREVKGLLPLTRPNLLPQASGGRAGDPIPTGCCASSRCASRRPDVG